MSPRHSGYRSEEFGFDADNRVAHRDEFEIVERGSPPGPSNGPLRTSRRALRRKTSKKVAIGGMQRRRNKHWAW